MEKMKDLAVTEVTLTVKGQELHDLWNLYNEWQDLDNQVKGSESDMNMDVQGLLHVLLRTGADHMRLEIANFVNILEARKEGQL